MKTLTVLLIEDDPVDVLMVRRVIDTMAVDVALHTTDSCLRAIDLLSGELAGRDLIILLDINLPRMDGLEFLAEIRKRPENRGVPVIVMSTSEDVYDVESCFEAGISGYMVKPFEFENMKELIGAIIRYWSFSLLPHRERFDPTLSYKRKKRSLAS